MFVSQPRRSSYLATRGYHWVGWKSVSAQRWVMRWPAPPGPPGSFVLHSISRLATDLGAMGAASVTRALVRCRSAARNVPGPWLPPRPDGGGALRSTLAPFTASFVITMPSVVSAGVDSPCGVVG